MQGRFNNEAVKFRFRSDEEYTEIHSKTNTASLKHHQAFHGTALAMWFQSLSVSYYFYFYFHKINYIIINKNSL